MQVVVPITDGETIWGISSPVLTEFFGCLGLERIILTWLRSQWHHWLCHLSSSHWAGLRLKLSRLKMHQLSIELYADIPLIDEIRCELLLLCFLRDDSVNINGGLFDLLRGNLSTVPHFGPRTKGACFPFFNSLFSSCLEHWIISLFQAFEELEEKWKKVTEAFMFQYSAKRSTKKKIYDRYFRLPESDISFFSTPFFQPPVTDSLKPDNLWTSYYI